MGLFDFLFGKKNSQTSSTTSNTKPSATPVSTQNVKPALVAEPQPKPVNLSSIANGGTFTIESNALTVVKQYYNGRQEEINVGPLSAKIFRTTQNGTVNITFSDLSTLRAKNIIQSNQSFNNADFQYNRDAEGNEFASAEVGNTFAHVTSGKEYVSLLQITKQNGKIVSFIINNLPNEDDFYYLIMFR